jgi:hypothetical protein
MRTIAHGWRWYRLPSGQLACGVRYVQFLLHLLTLRRFWKHGSQDIWVVLWLG